jgi:hypothetical protein
MSPNKYAQGNDVWLGKRRVRGAETRPKRLLCVRINPAQRAASEARRQAMRAVA